RGPPRPPPPTRPPPTPPPPPPRSPPAPPPPPPPPPAAPPRDPLSPQSLKTRVNSPAAGWPVPRPAGPPGGLTVGGRCSLRRRTDDTHAGGSLPAPRAGARRGRPG